MDEVEEIYNEEFPFENFNNMTFDNALILLKGDQPLKYSSKGYWLYFWGISSPIRCSGYLSPEKIRLDQFPLLTHYAKNDFLLGQEL